jgi:arylamine N-acetyltransferase
MSLLSPRPTYTRPQLQRYLQLVGQDRPVPSLEELEVDIQQDPLGALARIQLRHLAAVPFGNLALHYSTRHNISLDVEAVFEKIVDKRLGGYCMENNVFLSTVLRSLGYQVYPTGSRVSHAIRENSPDPEGYGGWTHMVNLVMLNGLKYMVDVGFGASNPTEPLPLRHDHLVRVLPDADARLVYDSIAPFTDSSQRMWIYQVRRMPADHWVAQYCFSELEFLPQDFLITNYYMSQSRASWFTHILVLAKFILHKDRDEPVGTLTLSGCEFKQRLNGQTQTLVVCKTEDERVTALQNIFGISLLPEEIRGIQGLGSEIMAK